jgi:hypothetical protein
MKLDKDTVIRQHFWFLLGLFVPLLAACYYLLATGVASAIDEKAKKLDESKKAVEGLKPATIKNQNWIAALEKKLLDLEKQKQAIWNDAWTAQASITTWPDSLKAEQFQRVLKDAPFGKSLDDYPQLREKFTDKDTGYPKQVESLQEIVDPVKSKDKGAVQFLKGWEAVLRPVKDFSGHEPPSEDIWLAQEDYWIQRGMLQIVRDANDFVARMAKVAGDPADKPREKEKDERDRQSFRNATWKLDLVLLPTQIRWQVTNVSQLQQHVDLKFRVKLRNAPNDVILTVQDEPLGPGTTSKPGFEKITLGDSFVSVEQVFDWKTVPVKRIDAIELGYPAHRLAGKPLVEEPALRGKSAAPAGIPGGPVAPGAPGGPGTPGTPGIPGGPGVGTPSESVGGDVTKFGLRRKRYLIVTEQVRRMPVAMTLIVDQARIQEVLTAVANSPLRIQITQVHWQRYRGGIEPRLDDPKPGPNPRDPELPPRPINPPPGGDPAKRPNHPARGSGEENLNLVELSVYGVASLYKQPPSANKALPPATPGGPTPMPPGPPPAAPPSGPMS